MSRVPHKMNVPGDFYVEDGCCTACDLPSTEAPGFFKYEITDNKYYPGQTASHCYFCKQPKNEVEIRLVLNAMTIQEFDCIRYKGKNDEVLKLMEREGVEEFSDIYESRLIGSDETKQGGDDSTTFLKKGFELVQLTILILVGFGHFRADWQRSWTTLGLEDELPVIMPQANGSDSTLPAPTRRRKGTWSIIGIQLLVQITELKNERNASFSGCNIY